MARTVEDVLARRTRALFLNANAAIALAPRVAEIMAMELGEDDGWIGEDDGWIGRQVTAFRAVAENYLVR
jgi:glycerol-3-phosphate dehydrogenase